MKIVRSHYEKIILLFAVITLALGVILSLFQSFESEQIKNSGQLAPFSLDFIEGETTIELVRDSELIPGDQVLFFNNESGDSFQPKITKVMFGKKSRVTVTLKSQKSYKGRLLNPNITTLSKSWQTSRTPLSLDTDDGVININFRDIERIKGRQTLVFSAGLKKIIPEDYSVSTYQNNSIRLIDSNRSEKIRWTNNSMDTNISIYDLFTPPIIYLVDGELTTSLPEIPQEAEKEESFGLKLKIFEKDKFRLKLSSWIGETPYFEDLLTKVSPNSKNNVKNRIEVKIPYKLNPNYRPGLPSFVKTTPDDEDKYLIVEYFAVQEIKDSKTGGSKLVGRALVKDYKTNSEPFEINSLMNEVFSGEYKIQLAYEIDGELPQDILLSAEDTGRRLEFGKRTYEIMDINQESKTIEISKEIKGTDTVVAQTLSL